MAWWMLSNPFNGNSKWNNEKEFDGIIEKIRNFQTPLMGILNETLPIVAQARWEKTYFQTPLMGILNETIE